MIIDTHIHLDSNKYNKDLEDVLKRAVQNGVEKFIIPGADPKDFKRAGQISMMYENIFVASGVHPYEIKNYKADEVERFASISSCVAIGECGLDYYRLPESKIEKEAEKKLQKEVFISQIEIAKRLKLPLIIHIREASFDSLEILKNSNAKEVGGVLHCFNADEILLELIEHNFYYGIGGVLTFKNAKQLPTVLKKIPLERIIIETDGPYLTPHPHRGERNEPAYCKIIAEKIAEILNITVNEVERVTTENAIKLFRF